MTTTVASTDEMRSMPAQIRMPYTLTPGTATGVFLAELAARRLLGSRHGDRILVPPAEFASDGAPSEGFVEVAPVGTIRSFTRTKDGVIGVILIDGTETPLLHRLIGFDSDELAVGGRVAAVWADEPTGSSVLDLAGFGPVGDAEGFAPRTPEGDVSESMDKIDYTMTLSYEHAYGHYYGTLFDGVKEGRRIRGVKCTACARVLVPPRGRCDVCYAPTGEWVDLPATGVVQASSVVHIEFIGQRVKPPYVYVEIILDGASTRLIHMIGDIDPEEAKTTAAPGARVRAVWSDRHTGSLADIEYFEVV